MKRSPPDSGSVAQAAVEPGGEAGIVEMLGRAKVVHVDARVLALHLTERGPVALTGAILAGVARGRIRAQTSSLSLYQILAEVYRQGEPSLARSVGRKLRLHAGLRVVPVDSRVAVQAAEVQAQLGGRAERALQIATALVCGAEIYLTAASGLRRVARMRVLDVEDYGDGPAAAAPSTGPSVSREGSTAESPRRAGPPAV